MYSQQPPSITPAQKKAKPHIGFYTKTNAEGSYRVGNRFASFEAFARQIMLEVAEFEISEPLFDGEPAMDALSARFS